MALCLAEKKGPASSLTTRGCSPGAAKASEADGPLRSVVWNLDGDLAAALTSSEGVSIAPI